MTAVRTHNKNDMKMTKTLALAALIAGSLIAGSNLQAQDSTNTPPAGGMRGRPNAEQIAKDLSLTDEQKTKVKAALEEQQTKMKALRADNSLSAEDKKTKMKELRDANQAKMKEILTPEQFAKWQKLQPARKGGPGAKAAAGTDNAQK